MKLDIKERFIIANQMKILEKLYPEEAEYYANHRKAIEAGYTLHYGWLFQSIHDDEMSNDECQEVLDILEMYRSIIFSYQNLEDKTGISEKEIHFPGFDGNNEAEQMAYTHYFIVDLKRYDEIRGDVEFPIFNSHIPMLSTYRKMLNTWKNMQNQRYLSKDDILKIIKAR